MQSPIDLVADDYRQRLQDAGIPAEPADRTPEQQQSAVMLFWAAKNSVAMSAASLALSALEG